MAVKKKKLVIVTENLGSQSIKRLAGELSAAVGYKVLRVRPGRERGRQVVSFPKGIDKLTQFNQFSGNGVSCPKFVTDTTKLAELNEYKDQRYVARKLLNSSEGKGIEIFHEGSQVPHARLYTQYVPKKKEFRVHVFNNVVIDIAEKRKRKGFEGDRDSQVRNRSNGYVFCRDNLSEPDGIRGLAVSAVQALRRTQGAVDIIWNEKLNKCFVLEVNSNPGMEGTTLQKYRDAIIGAL